MGNRLCPYKDKNGNQLFEGNLLMGRTNFDTVQGIIIFNEDGKNQYEQWRIQIEYHFTKYPKQEWEKIGSYSLYLAYHEKDGCCTKYEKIEKFQT